jgi:hypothetical protein
MAAFNVFLDSLSGEPECYGDPPLLTDPKLTEPKMPPAEVEHRTFGSRLAATEYLFTVFNEAGITMPELDRGLWAWLSLLYFDELCPKDDRGRRKPGDRARWIPQTESSREYYRHLLAGPYRIFVAHRDNPHCARLVLSGPLHTPGELVEQLASRKEYITNPGIMEAAARLYFDPVANRPRPGATTTNRGGTIRRFIDVLRQLDCTWDLYSFTADDILDKLPREFDRFKVFAGRATGA